LTDRVLLWEKDGDVFSGNRCYTIQRNRKVPMEIDIASYYEKYGPMVLRRCRQLLGNEDRALDAMQDTFVQLLRHAERLTADAPSSLLYRIATNTCLNILRGEKRRPVSGREEMLMEIASVDEHEERSVTRAFLEQLFSREKASTRTIAVLHYVDRLTLEETAAEVGLSVSGVRKRLRALSKRGLALEGAETS
jgi:RNA polymerase sigma-70 factor (ECF subfamily)